MQLSGDENTFTKILTTAPNKKDQGRARQPSWIEKRRRSLSGDGMIECPSCRGSGVRDVSTDLVALIPYSDERLKPRRTKSKIAFSLFLCSIIIGVMTYIFLPGKVIVTTTKMTIVSASIVDNRAPTNEHGIYSIDKPVNRSKITWMVGVNVINKNRFLPITVNELKLNLTWNALDEINVGYSVTGNFTVQAHQTYNSSILIETPQDNGKYQDWLLTCKCCRRFSHNRCSMDLHMFSLISLRYSLHIGQFNYFSDFASSRTPGHDNCNYFYNIDYGHRVKNLTCQTYEECHVNSGLGNYF